MSNVRRPRSRREATQSAGSVTREEMGQLLATNTGVRLACTMAATLSPFAIFLCWAEKEHGVIHRFAVQSTALAILHLLGAALLGMITLLVGKVPYFGFLMTLMGWLVYVANLIVAAYLRIKLMESAWHGRGYDLPMLERIVQKFY